MKNILLLGFIALTTLTACQNIEPQNSDAEIEYLHNQVSELDKELKRQTIALNTLQKKLETQLNKKAINSLKGFEIPGRSDDGKIPELFVDPFVNDDLTKRGSHQGPKGYAAPDWRKIPESSFYCPTYKANPKPPHDRTQCHHCATLLNKFGYKIFIPAK